jgi:hypothetical protein
LISFI